MRKEEIGPGIFVRLLSEYLRVPAGTLATVDSLGTLRNGDFYFTVRWLTAPTGTHSGPVSDRSLNLWVFDLEKFEIVSNEEAKRVLAISRSARRSKGLDGPSLRRNSIVQLHLPFLETEA
jgi:hypothetical protein